MWKLPFEGGCEEGEAGGGAESVMVGECCEMVGRVGVWQLDSLDILRSGLWVAVRTEEEDARLSSRVNYKGEAGPHTHAYSGGGGQQGQDSSLHKILLKNNKIKSQFKPDRKR